jgi:hypothetical protein
MKSRDFPLAVRKAFGGSLADDNVIPCLRPYSNMNLLHFVDAKNLMPLQVKRLFRSHSIKVLNNSGVSTDTLVEHADDDDIKGELQVIVTNATPQTMLPSTNSMARNIVVGVFMAVEQLAGFKNDTGIGVKIMRDSNWTLTNGIVVKKATSRHDLKRILSKAQATFDVNFDLIHGVVTAIYFVQGPFSFTKTINARLGLQIDPAFTPGNTCAGINCNFTNEGRIAVTADDGREWIIAIELSECELRQQDDADANRIGNRLPHQQAAENGIVRNHYKLATIILAMAIFLQAWMTCFGLPWLSLGRLGLPSIIPFGS